MPVFFFAVMVNVACPFSLVDWLAGETDIRFFPDAPIVAVTVSPSTGQPSLPVIFTVTSLLAFLLSVSLFGDTTIEVATHTGVAVGVSTGEGVTVIVGIGEGRAVEIGVAVGVIVGVTDVVIVGVGVGISVMVKLESWTLEPS